MLRVLRPPPGTGHARRQQHEQQEGRGQAVGPLRDARLADRRLLHQRHHLGVARAFAHLADAQLHRLAQVVAAGNHRLAPAARHRARFARQQGLVHRGLAAQDRAVGHEALARQHAQHVAHAHATRRHALPAAARIAALHAVGQAVHQRLQRAGGAVAQAQLQPAPGQQEKHEHGERVEVHLVAEGPAGSKVPRLLTMKVMAMPSATGRSMPARAHRARRRRRKAGTKTAAPAATAPTGPSAAGG
jgi:hypothetical protein